MSKIKIAIVDDDPVWLNGMETFINETDDLSVIAMALNKAEALQAIKDHEIDIILMDINLGDGDDGVYLTVEIAESKGIKTIMKDTIEKIQSSFALKNAYVIVGIYAAQHPFEGIASNYKNLHLRYTRMIMEAEVHIFDGSCVAIKKEVFDRVSGFDEHIKILAGENWDLANRISEMGYKIILDKSIPFIHRKYYTVANLFRTDLRKAFGVIKLMLRRSKRKKGLLENSRVIAIINGIFLVYCISVCSFIITIMG